MTEKVKSCSVLLAALPDGPRFRIDLYGVGMADVLDDPSIVRAALRRRGLQSRTYGTSVSPMRAVLPGLPKVRTGERRRRVVSVKCPLCSGDGFVDDWVCTACGGGGRVALFREVKSAR